MTSDPRAGIRYFDGIRTQVQTALNALNAIDTSAFLVAGHFPLNSGIAAARSTCREMIDQLDAWIAMMEDAIESEGK